MPIPKEQLDEFRQRLDGAARPLFFFDDDCDGVTSFVQLYRYKGEGKGIAVKSSPIVGEMYARKVDEYSPDLIVILDKPMVADEFFEKVTTPILWLDHHGPQDVSKWKNVTYYNPRLQDDADNLPTSYWCHKIVHKSLWLATVGAVADWHMPDYINDFAEKYADLLPPDYAKVEDLLFSPASQLGKLIKIINFTFKGTVQEMMKSVLVLTRVTSPYEILNQTTPRGKFLYKKYLKLAKMYDGLLTKSKKKVNKKTVHFVYADDTSFTSELSNELLYLYPELLIIVGRKHEDDIKYSLRSAQKYDVATILEKALVGVEGYGGGHKYACGASVKEKDAEAFIANLEKQL